MLYTFREKLPIVIIRPSLVWGSVNEPVKGYIEGMHSGMGIICGGMTGFLRTICVDKESRLTYTPADYAISATIVSAWKRAVASEGDLLIFNCTDALEKPLHWDKIIQYTERANLESPPYDKLFWYPYVTITSSYTWFMLMLVLFQLLPAMLFDLVRLISGNKAM